MIVFLPINITTLSLEPKSVDTDAAKWIILVYLANNTYLFTPFMLLLGSFSWHRFKTSFSIFFIFSNAADMMFVFVKTKKGLSKHCTTAVCRFFLQDCNWISCTLSHYVKIILLLQVPHPLFCPTKKNIIFEKRSNDIKMMDNRSVQ